MDLDKKIKLDKIMEKTEFSTDVGRKRKFLDKLFLGTRVYFVIRYALIILKMSIKAKKGNYGVEEFKQHSMLVLDLVEDCGGKVKIEGLDNIWACKDEPVVFVGNHMSTLETQLLPLFILPVKNLTFVIKRSLLTFPFFGHIMRATNPIAVTRINPREDLKIVMDEGIEKLKNGISVIIFQQGSRNPVFNPETFSSLGIKLAQKAKCKVVPIALKTDFWGNAKLVRDLGPIRRSEEVHISFGKPVEVVGNGKELNQEIIKFIQEKLEEWGHNPDQNSL